MTAPPNSLAGRKRFYKAASIDEAPTADGSTFRVLLDGRELRTPARRPLVLPTRALAEAVAAEWEAQGDAIDPGTMPLTRLVNSAIDGVADRAQEVRSSIVDYGGSDLLCYLAEGPQPLVDRQSRRWGEVHAWVKQAFGIELEFAVGVMPVKQSADTLAALDRALGERTPLELAGLHVMTSSMGSALLSLAVLHGRLSPAEAWELAHLDEDFQIEKWGRDEEAAERRERRWKEMQAAALAVSASGRVAGSDGSNR